MVSDKQNILDAYKNLLPSFFGEKRIQSAKESSFGFGFNFIGRNLFSHSFNGEKNLGEIGPPKSYYIDYDTLRIRSWQSFLESEITQTVLSRYDTWVIGSGLRLKSEPNDKVLKLEGVTLDVQTFSENVEAYFSLFRDSQLADYSSMKTLDELASAAHKNALVGGDVLVVLRYENDNISVQLIDGGHLQSPMSGTDAWPTNLPDGVKLMNGVEVDAKGMHIAFWICTSSGSYERVSARGHETGLQMAFLVYGLEYRLNNIRGLPLISVVLETLKKLERYKEATVGSAEERQKIALAIEHQQGAGDENPFEKQLSKAWDVDYSANEDIAVDINGQKLTDTVIATTNKQVVNLPMGAKLTQLESKNELYFKDFYGVNIDLVCAALAIPPNVAMSKYDTSFSSSRASLKDWELTLNVKRKKFSNGFYKNIYNFFLEVMIYKNKINAPGYIKARADKNNFVIEAYRKARFIGAPVPHIDPVKEVMAERLKLGTTGAHIPLTTAEDATENLGGGEFISNAAQYSKDLDLLSSLKIEIAAPITSLPDDKPKKKKKDNDGEEDIDEEENEEEN